VAGLGLREEWTVQESSNRGAGRFKRALSVFLVEKGTIRKWESTGEKKKKNGTRRQTNEYAKKFTGFGRRGSSIQHNDKGGSSGKHRGYRGACLTKVGGVADVAGPRLMG